MKAKHIISILILINYGVVFSQNDNSTSEAIKTLAWFSIPPQETSVERYSELRNCGIDFSITHGFKNIIEVKKALDVAGKTGLKLFISCPELFSETKKTVKSIMNHPALAGYFVSDEPKNNELEKLGQIVQSIRAIDNNNICYVNLHPDWGGSVAFGIDNYEEYVDNYIKYLSPEVVTFDSYPIANGKLRPSWYKNLKIIAEKAENAGKPFWAFALAVAHGPYPVPTLAELRLQVFSNLAYGAQCIQYFTYWTPPNYDWNFHEAPISIDGKRTHVYDKIKKINKEIEDLSFVFNNAKVISINHTGDTIPEGTNRLVDLPSPIKKLETKGAGAVVSLLQKDKEKYLVIVNRDFINSMQLMIDTDSNVYRITKEGCKIPADIYSQSMLIDPGDLIIYNW